MASPSTPPNSQDVTSETTLSDTTPLRRDIFGSAAHASSPTKKASERYADMTFDLCEKFVGPMPVDVFLEEFVPEAPVARPHGNFTFFKDSVSQNEDEFIDAIRSSGLCPDLHLLNTTSLTSATYPGKPDISIFSRSANMSSVAEQPKELNWGLIEFWIENKPKPDDPFMKIGRLRKDAEDVSSHVGWTNGAYKTCGQLISYASGIHRSQFRVFSFSIALFGKTGRLLRWDRSGVIYTAPFPWQDGILFEFLWRFNHLSAVDRGHDITISSAGDDEAEVALPKLKTYPKFENLKREHLHQILVWDDCAPAKVPRRYITPSGRWATEALIGRATFGYIAYDVEDGNLVYLKDFWRVDHPEIQKEGDVYRELHEAQVPNVAEMDRAGDVPLVSGNGELQVAFLAVQRTRTQDYVTRSWCPGHPQVEPYVHYRLVLKTVGIALNQFKSTRQLCGVIRDAVIAHRDAYSKARILHRDVSAGNILITEKGSGILIDWDLSKKVKEYAEPKPRLHSRTGTWQFISVARLLDPWSTPHQLSDDLESFFWVLLYQVVRYRDRKMGLRETMVDVFDQYESKKVGRSRGGKGKLAVLQGTELSTQIVMSLAFRTPCSSIIEELRALFRDFYLLVSYQTGLEPEVVEIYEKMRETDPRVQEARRKLQSSETFLAILEKHLNSAWDVDDDGSLDLSEPLLDSSASRNRRRREAGDSNDDSRNIHVRRRGLMPPRSIEGSRDELSSQTSSNNDELFSMHSRMHSSSSIRPSGTPRTSDDGPSSK